MDDRQQDRPLIGNETVSWQHHHWPLSGNSVRCFAVHAMQFLLPIDWQYPQCEQVGLEVELQM
jgi:hypothetical protein